MARLSKVRQMQRVVSGPEMLEAAEQLRKLQDRRNLWPYEWIFPPPDSQRVHAEGTLDAATLVPGTQAQVLSYQVPNNYSFYFNALAQLYIGPDSFVPGDGQLVWDLDVNIPLGTASPQGYPVQGFSNSGIPKGAYISGIFAPYPLAPKPEKLGPLDTLRSKVTTFGGGITQGRIIAIFDGWLLPYSPQAS